jgi:hypothetical protein
MENKTPVAEILVLLTKINKKLSLRQVLLRKTKKSVTGVSFGDKQQKNCRRGKFCDETKKICR